jgi:hypothetical protein
MKNLCLTLALWLALVAICDSSFAFFHLWKFSEAFTNDTGSVQFIEMTTTSPGETVAVGIATMIIQSQATGKTFTFNHNLSGSTTNKRILIATSGFESSPGLPASPPLLTPDYTLPADFLNAPSDTIRFCQNNCTGFNVLDTRTFTSLPIDGTMSLIFPSNAAALNSPTNFAGTTGSANLAPQPPETTGDYNGNGIVDAADYTVWRDTFGDEVDEGTGADGMPDGTIDDEDYDFWKSRFGDVVDPPGRGSATSIVIPEPAVITLTIMGLLALLVTTRRARRGSILS